MDLHALDATHISMSGTIGHLREPDKIVGNIHLHQASTTRQNLHSILPDSLLPATISVPESMLFSGTYMGSLSDFVVHTDLHSTDGDASLDATFKNLRQASPQYALAFSTPRFALGKLIQQPNLGSVSGLFTLQGEGLDKDKAVADLHSSIQFVEFHNYSYKNIKLDGAVEQAGANLFLSVQDSNLSMRLNSKLGWKAHQEFCQANLTLFGADLYQLGVWKEQVQVSTNMEMDVQGISLDHLKGEVDFRKVLFVKQDKEYRVDSILVALENKKDYSQLDIKSPILTANYQGNMDVFSVPSLVQQQVDHYFDITAEQSKYQSSRKFDFEMTLQESPLIEDLLLPSLSSYDQISVKGGFNGDAHRLWAVADFPWIEYSDVQAKGGNFQLDSDKDKLTYGLSLSSLARNGIQLDPTSLKGEVKEDQATIHLQLVDSTGKDKLVLKSLLSKAGSNYRYSILEKGLQIQNEAWNVDKENYVEFGKEHLFVHQFKIGHDEQSIYANSSANTPDADLQVRFEKFQLHTLSQLIEQSDSIYNGVIDGDVLFVHYQKQFAFSSAITISDLSYKSSKIGNLSLKVDNTQESKYNLLATLKGMGNQVNMSGYYNTVKKEDGVHMNVDIGSLQLSSLEAFSMDQLSKSSGAIKGSFVINGALSAPSLNGAITFDQVRTKVGYLNEVLILDNETIQLSNEGFSFSSFTIKDTSGHTAKLDGTISMKSLEDIRFNLDMTTNHFLVLNTTAAHNKLYYGKVVVDSQIKLRGTPDLPKITSNIRLVKGSKFTYTVPESKLSVDKGEGVVVFLADTSQVSPIMLRGSKVVTQTKGLKGFELSSKLKIDDQSTLKIIIDPISGDSLVVRGNADLDFGIDQSGKPSLSGTYTLSNGSYKAYLQENFVTREFALVKDSKITWSGDPMDAYADLSARYDVRTNSRDLMTLGTPGAIITDSSLLVKSLTFNVFLMMRGELLKPQISFKLDMPEEERAFAGGVVYTKLNEVNQNESELNKQVFALLVLNKFIPATTSGGAGSTVSSLARSSVSKLMTDQLNQLSGRYIKGAEINVDLQSYNYSQNGQAQSNTQVNLGVKKDFNRFTVKVGSNVQLEGQQAAQQNNVQNFTGDIQVGYKLTEDGRYQTKAFRQNQVDNLVNGTVIETGVGIMYRRDYNSFKELFFSPKKKKK
jgi:hypothetical protein